MSYLSLFPSFPDVDQLVRRFALAPHLSDQQELQKCLVRQHEIEKVMGDEFKNLPEGKILKKKKKNIFFFVYFGNEMSTNRSSFFFGFFSVCVDASHESEEKKTDMEEGYFKVMEKSQSTFLIQFSLFIKI